jgi:hypothetical protein
LFDDLGIGFQRFDQLLDLLVGEDILGLLFDVALELEDGGDAKFRERDGVHKGVVVVVEQVEGFFDDIVLVGSGSQVRVRGFDDHGEFEGAKGGGFGFSFEFGGIKDFENVGSDGDEGAGLARDFVQDSDALESQREEFGGGFQSHGPQDHLDQRVDQRFQDLTS